MKGYVVNIEEESKNNADFRKVLYTAKNSQLVLMSLLPSEEIGSEVHTLDQFLRIEAGAGVAILDGIEHQIGDGYAVVVPAGTEHNIKNTSADVVMKIYTVYSPPDHKDGTVHLTKADAIADTNDHFDGITSE